MNAVLPAANLSLRNTTTTRTSIATYLLPYDVEIAVARIWQREVDTNNSG